MKKFIVFLLVIFVLLPGYTQWYSDYSSGFYPESDYKYDLKFCFDDFSGPITEEPEDGWCCKDGKILAINAEECGHRGGKFFLNRKDAENYCSGKGEEPPENQQDGWCCINGDIIKSSERECINRGGVFYRKRKSAKEYCLKEREVPPEEELPPGDVKEVWCCINGEITPSFPKKCSEDGGEYFETYKEAEEFCLRKIRELEKEEQPKEVIKEILCCRNGEIFHSDPEDCRKQGGLIFNSMKEAEDFCFEKRQLPRVSDPIFIKAVSGKTLEKTRKKNLFTPIFVKLIHRYLEEREDLNELDRIFRDALNRVGGIKRELLEKIVRVYNDQNDNERSSRFEPIAPDKNDLAPITIEDVRKSFKKIYPIYFNNPDKFIEISGGVPSPPNAKKKAGPYINYITPMGAKPGTTIYIYGKNYAKKANFIVMKSINITPEWSKIISYPKVANSQHRLEMVIPKNAPTCKYEFQVTTIFGSSNKVYYSMSGHQYKVVFNEMHCIDETDPEELQSDEMVTFWTIIADDNVINKSSRTYTGFNDGTKWSYTSPDDLVLDWTEIKSGLSIATELWEWDEGDIESAKKIAKAGGLVAMVLILQSYGGNWGILAGIALTIITENFDWIAKNIFGVDNDLMGKNIMTWSQGDLNKILSTKSSVAYIINFKDHGGEYNVDATISFKK